MVLASSGAAPQQQGQSHQPQQQYYHRSGSPADPSTAFPTHRPPPTGNGEGSPTRRVATGLHDQGGVSVMERVLFRLHLRSCHFGLRHSSTRMRRLVEHLLLLVAIAGFGALILLHRSFVFRIHTTHQHRNSAATCLASIPKFDPTADIHHVSILPTTTNITSSYVVMNLPSNSNLTLPTPTPLYSFSASQAFLLLPPHHHLLNHLKVQHIVTSPHDPACFGEPFLQALIHNFVGYDTIVMNWLLPLLLEKSSTSPLPNQPLLRMEGYVHQTATGRLQELKLPAAISINLGTFRDIPHTNHHLFSKEGSNNAKMAQRLASSFFFYFLGSQPSTTTTTTTTTTTDDTTCLSSSEATDTNPPPSPNLFMILYPRDMLSKISVLLQTTFLFFFSTTLVSFTLRETQERMLEFTQELSRRVSVSLPLVDLVVFHLIHNLVFVPIMVGMMFFLIEFYSGDKFLAFLVMSIVWCVEVFSVVSLRSFQGITFFPKMFFLLFCLFHIYYFANPHGFGYIALLVVGCFMWHSMVFFWHRYELPAVALGRVTVDHPRMNVYTSPFDPTGAFSNNSAPIHTTSPPDPNSMLSLHRHDASPQLTHSVGGPFPGAGSASSAMSSSRMVAGNTHTAHFVPQHRSMEPQSPPRIRLSNPSNAFAPTYNPRDAYDPSEHTAAGHLQQPSTGGSQNHLIMNNHRNASFSTVSSRNSGGIFRRGDEEDDESYMYFMEGEVVLHRPHSNVGSMSREENSTLASAGGSTASIPNLHTPHINSLPRTGSNSMIGSASIVTGSRSNNSAGHSFQRQDSLVGLDMSQYDESEEDLAVLFASPERMFSMRDAAPVQETQPLSCNDQSQQQHQQEQQHTSEAAPSQIYSGEESSGLQAILEVRLTPRLRNTGSSAATPAVDGTNDTPANVARGRALGAEQSLVGNLPPTFPELPSSRRRE